jgi:hypothetical protein
MRGGIVPLIGVPNVIVGNKTFTGLFTINNQAVVNGVTGAVPTLQLKAASGQTGNLLELYNSSSTRVAYFDQSGNFTSTGAVSYSSTAVSQGASGVGFSVKAYGAGNSSDVMQWQNSAGQPLMGVNAAGQLYGTGGLSLSGSFTLTMTGSQTFAVTGTGSIPLLSMDANNGNFKLKGPGGTTLRASNAQLQVIRPSVTSDVEGITFFAGVARAASIIRAPNSDDLVIGFDNGTTFTSSVTFPSGAQQGLVINGALGLQIRGDNSATDPGVPWMRSDGINAFFNPHTGGYIALAYDAGVAVYLGNTNGIVVSTANSNSDPGRPWIRSDGTSFFLNAHTSSGVLYLNNDSQGPVRAYGQLTVDNAGINAGSIDLQFGPGSGEGIGSKRTAGGNQNGIDFYTASTQRMYLTNTGDLHLNNSLYVSGGTAITGGLTISGSGSSFSQGLTISGGGLSVTGNSTFNNTLTVSGGGLVVTGNSTFNNDLIAAQHKRSDGSPLINVQQIGGSGRTDGRLEVYLDPNGVSVGSGATVDRQFIFTHPFAAAPAITASYQKTSPNPLEANQWSVVSADTGQVTVRFRNGGTGTETLSHFSIWAAGY